jgi:signal transduction histidine kinase
MVVFGAISYVGSRWFVRRALRDLHELSAYVSSLDVDTLHSSIDFEHLPDDDEIQTVARAINEMGSKIDMQVASIKQFISYVSHEFKTPLMVMRTDAELALKSQNFEVGLKKNVQGIDTLNRLLESLLLLTRAQSGNTLHRGEVVIRDLVEECLTQVQQQYSKKLEVSIE